MDYAILKDGKPIILFECKKSGSDLNINHASQLFRYFHVTEARFGVLTNGLIYRFFTDLDQPNKMDEKPFLEFDLLDFKDQEVDELKKFAKAAFNVDTILTTANELKYTRSIQNLLSEWMNAPSEGFVRLVSADLMAGKRFTSANLEQFTQVTKRAFQQLIGDRINDRLKVAMTPEIADKSELVTTESTPVENSSEPETQQIETTAEEIEAFHIIKSILREIVSTSRITMKDAKSYCPILLDGKVGKTVCRLYFNNPKKLAIGLIVDKKEEKISLADLDGIYDLADRLKAIVNGYIQS